jgi:hypothetical protein
MVKANSGGAHYRRLKGQKLITVPLSSEEHQAVHQAALVATGRGGKMGPWAASVLAREARKVLERSGRKKKSATAP